MNGQTLTQSTQYDSDGNVVRSTDRDGRVTTYTYNQDDQPLTETWYADAADANRANQCREHDLLRLQHRRAVDQRGGQLLFRHVHLRHARPRDERDRPEPGA